MWRIASGAFIGDPSERISARRIKDVLRSGCSKISSNASLNYRVPGYHKSNILFSEAFTREFGVRIQRQKRQELQVLVSIEAQLQTDECQMIESHREECMVEGRILYLCALAGLRPLRSGSLACE